MCKVESKEVLNWVCWIIYLAAHFSATIGARGLFIANFWAYQWKPDIIIFILTAIIIFQLGHNFSHVTAVEISWLVQKLWPGGHLNIKMPSYQYRDSHVKDKTVSPTVLSLTWESPYLGKTVFILRRGPDVIIIFHVKPYLYNKCMKHLRNVPRFCAQ